VYPSDFGLERMADEQRLGPAFLHSHSGDTNGKEEVKEGASRGEEDE
jgi:hypothetical protein